MQLKSNFSSDSHLTVTAFHEYQRLMSGPLPLVALAVKRACDAGASGAILVFDDSTGHVIDIDTRGSDEEIVRRLSEADRRKSPPYSLASIAPEEASPVKSGSRARGRPKLGVVAREVTLLPRHWEWLNTQPGGASVALRKLVEEARHISRKLDQTRLAQEAAYRFMSAIAGDFPGFEEATRALFANNREKFASIIAPWERDICSYATQLAFSV